MLPQSPRKSLYKSGFPEMTQTLTVPTGIVSPGVTDETKMLVDEILALSQRITNLTEAERHGIKIFRASRSLSLMVAERRAMLRLLKKRDADLYQSIIRRLGLSR